MLPFSMFPGIDHESSTTFRPEKRVCETNDRSFPDEEVFHATPTVVGNENGALLFTTVSAAIGISINEDANSKTKNLMSVPFLNFRMTLFFAVSALPLSFFKERGHVGEVRHDMQAMDSIISSAAYRTSS